MARSCPPTEPAGPGRPAPVRRPRPIQVAAFAAVVASLALLAVLGVSRGYQQTGDTQTLVRGVLVARQCIHHDTWTQCGRAGRVNSTAVGPYPLLQYLPALAFEVAGLGLGTTVAALAWTSLVAFAVVLGLLAWSVRRDAPFWRPVLLALAFSGPLLFYATSSFGEVLGAAAVLAFVVAARARRPWLVLVLAAMACLAKETLPPFLLVLGILVARDADDGWLPPARVMGPLCGGLLAGVAASAAFNEFRFGTLTNHSYLLPSRQVTGLTHLATNTVGLWFAPGGGLALFWPSLALFLVAFCAVAVGAIRRRAAARAIAQASLLVVVGAFTLGLAAWWSPFGWVAWGPRLFLVVLPAVLVVAVHVGGEPLTRLVARGLRWLPAFALIAAVTVVGAFPEASAPWVGTRAVDTLLVPGAHCTRRWPTSDHRFWLCLDERAWRLHDTPLRTATGDTHAVTWLGRIVLLSTATILLLAARAAAAPDEDGPDPDPERRPVAA